MNRQRKRKRRLSFPGQFHERTQRVSLLPQEDAVVLDRSIRSPVPDRGERHPCGSLRHGPFAQDDRRKRRDPPTSARRHAALRLPDREGHRREVGVRVESHVDATAVPRLIESGIEIEVDAPVDRLEEHRVFQHPGHVDEDIRFTDETAKRRVTHTDGLGRPFEQQRSGSRQAERAHDAKEAARRVASRERRADRTKLRRGYRLDEADIVAEMLEAEDVLEHGPRGAALCCIGGKHAREHDFHTRTGFHRVPS